MDKEEILEKTKHIVEKIAHKYSLTTPKFSKEDLIAEGQLTVLKCCDYYNEDAKTKFTTYVYGSVNREMRKFVGRNLYDISISEYFQNKDRPETGLIADRLDRTIGSSNTTGENLVLSDVIPSGQVEPTQIVEKQEYIEALHSEIEKLPSKERDIIKLYWFENQSYSDIAEQFGVSKQNIHAIEKKVRTRLGTALKGKFANEFFV